MPRRKQTSVMQLKELGAGARVFVYARDSGGAAQVKSVTDQRAELAAYAAQRGWVIVRWFLDEATSAGDIENRVAFQELIMACRQQPPPVAGVLVWSLSRFGRDELDSQFYRLELRRNGVDVVSATDQVPGGTFAPVFEAFIDWKNRAFLDEMSRDVRRGLRANVAAGYAPGGTPPTGYRAERIEAGLKRDGQPRLVAKWVVDEAKAEKVKQAFAMCAAGYSYEEIHAATDLLRSKPSYWSMFRNRTYLGILKFGAEEFPGALPALVDAATFEAVQARMTHRQEAAGKARRRGSEYLLSGLLVCGRCGAAMVGGRNGQREERGIRLAGGTTGAEGSSGWGPPPAMRRMWRPTRWSSLVVNTVLDRVLTPENFQRLLAKMRAALADPTVTDEMRRLEGEMSRLRRLVGNLLDMVEDGGGQEVKERLKAREGELARLQTQYAELQQRQKLAAFELSDAELEAVLAAMRADVQSAEVAVARRALSLFVRVVDAERLVIWYHEPALMENARLQCVPPRGFEPLHQA